MSLAAKESGQSPEDVKRKQLSPKESSKKGENKRTLPCDDEAMGTDLKKSRGLTFLVG